MSTTSMSLKSLQFLLQHMDANKRFEISQHCPALREFEKSVPLKINCLVLTESYVVVNDTSYKLGIIRKCKVGEAPSHVAKSNEEGGDPYELDRYGIRDETDTFTVTPGDIVIDQHREQFMRNEDEHVEELEELIQIGEGELADMRGRRPSRQNLDKIQRIEKAIEDSRARLLEYQRRRENIPTNYELFFQLTKTRTVDEKKQITLEKYVHNKKYSEAIKDLTTVLFGGRSSPIVVTKFKLHCSQGVIRLPVGLKLHIEQMIFCADFGTSVGVLTPILHESSFPLKKLDLIFFSNEEATSPVVKTAGILGIRVLFRDPLQTISAITNPVVHFNMTQLSGQITLLEGLVEHWIVSKRPLGYEYIFHYSYEPGFAIEMDDILKKLDGKPVDDESVIRTMSSSISMPLESLHFLLQHMEANRRFEIYNRCPALRVFEKTVPLKINSLVLTGNHVVVNETTYKLGIVQKCKVGETPRCVAARNEIGGAEYELDAYGIIDESDSRTVTPGDVAMIQHEELFVQDENLFIIGLEQMIQIFEENLAGQRERRPRGNREVVDRMVQTIERARVQLFDYQCRRDNIPSRYENFLQLTKSRTVDMQERKTFERYIHNKKFSEAMKQLANVLFGGRSSPIYVTKSKFFCVLGVIRLPVGLKIHIEQLVFRADSRTSVGVLAPILEESSFPLKKLEMGVLSVNDATNPIVKTAEILRIGDIFQNNLQTVLSMTNPVIHIGMLGLPEEAIEELVRNWIASKCPIGRERIFGFFREPILASEVEDILKKLNGAPVDEENFIIPMSNSIQLKVSYGPFPEFAPRSKWAVRFLTEAIEH